MIIAAIFKPEVPTNIGRAADGKMAATEESQVTRFSYYFRSNNYPSRDRFVYYVNNLI